MIGNFSYLIDGLVAGSARPGYCIGLQKELAWLSDEGFKGIVTLTSDELSKAMLAENGLDSLHIPIPDFGSPTHRQVVKAVEFIQRHTAVGEAVLVHCAAGYGRTGTILGCYLASQGMSADEAIARVRQKRPGSIETDRQEQAIQDYAATLAD